MNIKFINVSEAVNRHTIDIRKFTDEKTLDDFPASKRPASAGYETIVKVVRTVVSNSCEDYIQDLFLYENYNDL